MSNFRSDFHTELSQLVLEDIQYQRSKYYYFLGKVEEWNSTDTPEATPIDSMQENNLLRANMLYAKLISPSDVSLATRTYIWSLGQVWDRWDHTLDMYPGGVPRQFYCLTDDDRVYKCLDRPEGGESSIMPTGTSIAPIRLDDGYLWKYMYTIPSFKKSRFLTGAYMPVQRALTDNFFNKGELDSAVVTASGSGYTNTALTTITVGDAGHTTGSGATATITLGSIGQITGYTLTSGGSGYTKGVKIDINHTTGSGAVLTAVINGSGVVTGINIVSAGIGYNAGTTITFRVGGAVLIPKVSTLPGGDSIRGVIIKDPGAGYSSVPTLTLNSASGTGKYSDPGTGIMHTGAIIKAVIHEGEIKTVAIEDPGLSYQAGTGTIITVQGDGENAAMTPVVYNGELVDVILDNPGTGYTYTIVTVTDTIGTGGGAVVKGIIDNSDFGSDQSIIEQTAVPGAIYAIGITDGGNGYVAPTITIHGDGTGATATCTVNNGIITGTYVTNFGSGYSTAWAEVTDAVGAGAELYPILPPSGGHGSNAAVELYGDTLAFNTSLRESIIATAIQQDFRQFGILKNPRDSINFGFYTQDNALIVYEIIVNNTIDMEIDEVLVQGSTRYRVAEIDGTKVYLIKLSSAGIPVEGQTMLAEAAPTRSYLCQTVLSSPSFNKYSGHLLYISHEAPFKFTTGQGIVIKTFIKF